MRPLLIPPLRISYCIVGHVLHVHRNDFPGKTKCLLSSSRKWQEKNKNKRLKYSKFKHLKDDPEFSEFLNSMLDGKLAAREKSKATEHQKTTSTKSKGILCGCHVNKNTGNELQTEVDLDRNCYSHDKQDVYNDDRNRENLMEDLGEETENLVDMDGIESVLQTAPPPVRTFKSPSDTTLYSPGLCKVSNKDDLNIIERISNFVEKICLDNNRAGRSIVTPPVNDNRRVEQISSAGRREHEHWAMPSTSSRDVETTQHEHGKVTDQLLIQAEIFKAKVEAPKGNYEFTDMLMPYDYDKLSSKFIRSEGLAPLDREILFLHNFDQDDKFFHVTSQIDPTLKSKIEKGEFIELEWLLPKDRSPGSRSDDINKQLFKLIIQGTNSYVEPPMPPKAGKINNVRKWDQAFRVFAAIYTNANPRRAAEIWQYVYVIHTAAAANPWDNLYFYYINFRELMASKPWRSWRKTYTQGWNIAFNNSSVSYLNSSGGGGSSSSTNNNSQFAGNRSWKDDCCWHFNKNRCKRPGSECNYDHRCTYCGGWNHGFFSCKKRKNRYSYGGGKTHSPHKKSDGDRSDRRVKK